MGGNDEETLSTMKRTRPMVSLRLENALVLLMALLAVSSTVRAQETGQLKRKTGILPEVFQEEMVTRQAICRRVSEPPVLDGKLDDRCWQQAAVIDHFASYWTKTPRPGTFAYLVWDDDALYYAASMVDSELRSFGTKRNDTLWEGDVFELFFKPSAATPEYFEFQANPRMLVFEMAFPRRGVDPLAFKTAPPLGSKAVVELKGTLDQPGDRDTGWSVEGRIPWSAFAAGGGKPKVGDEWLFALCRYDYGPSGTRPVLMSSAPLTEAKFHRYEDYGKLRFEGPLKPAQ
jgi:Carbohydrate family 9 binding domain-like